MFTKQKRYTYAGETDQKETAALNSWSWDYRGSSFFCYLFMYFLHFPAMHISLFQSGGKNALWEMRGVITWIWACGEDVPEEVGFEQGLEGWENLKDGGGETREVFDVLFFFLSVSFPRLWAPWGHGSWSNLLTAVSLASKTIFEKQTDKKTSA